MKGTSPVGAEYPAVLLDLRFRERVRRASLSVSTTRCVLDGRSARWCGVRQLRGLQVSAGGDGLP